MLAPSRCAPAPRASKRAALRPLGAGRPLGRPGGRPGLDVPSRFAPWTESPRRRVGVADRGKTFEAPSPTMPPTTDTLVSVLPPRDRAREHAARQRLAL